ncbi:MAG: hypothetical protein U0841_19015 [Chloroflexia bacterium]
MGVGTPGKYMAPEQAKCADALLRPLRPRHHGSPGCSTARLYSGNSTVEVLMQHLQQPIPLERPRRQSGASAGLGPIPQRALAKDPNHRYQTGRELMQAVNTAIAQTGFNRWASAPTVVAGTPPPAWGTPQPGVGTPTPFGQGTPPPFSPGTSPPSHPGTPPPVVGPGTPQPFTVAYTPPPQLMTTTAGTDNRRILIIIAIVIGVAIVICCCLFLVASLSN